MPPIASFRKRQSSSMRKSDTWETPGSEHLLAEELMQGMVNQGLDAGGLIHLIGQQGAEQAMNSLRESSRPSQPSPPLTEVPTTQVAALRGRLTLEVGVPSLRGGGRLSAHGMVRTLLSSSGRVSCRSTRRSPQTRSLSTPMLLTRHPVGSAGWRLPGDGTLGSPQLHLS